MAYFERVRDLDLKQAKIAAFGSTCRVGSQPADDANIRALLDAQTPVVTVVGKSWMLHVTEVLRTTPEENLRIIRESVAYLLAQGKEVIYDAEHFFDGYKADPAYTLSTLQAAVDGGAQLLVLCDTNGGVMPWEIEQFVGEVKANFPDVALGIHTHNDGGMADANTLAAVRAGAVHVQGTMNGYGERCGNANLCTLIPNLELKMGFAALPEGHLLQLNARGARHLIYRQSGAVPPRALSSGGARSRTRAASTSPRCAAIRVATSTLTPRWWATSRASSSQSYPARAIS